MNIDFARQQMVNQQVRGWNVYDEDVLAALRKLPREQFVPAGFETLAFADTEIAIGHGQHMMTPTVEGRVLQALGLDGDERVLEVGTGSGFLTACLASLAAEVTSIDIYDDFLQLADSNLATLGLGNIELLNMNAMQELPDGGFDAIAVTGSLQSLDTRFVDALNTGGKLFVIVGNAPAMKAQLVERGDAGDWRSLSLFETTVAPLVNGARPPQFSF